MAVIDKTLTNPHVPPAGFDRPVVPVWVEIDLATADVDSASDDLLLFQFPPVAKLRNEAGIVELRFSTAVDSGGATWQYDLVIGGADAVADFTLDANSTAGRADNDIASSDQIATEALHLDVGGLYLALNIDAVGDQPGVVEVALEYSQNVKKYSD